MRFATNFEQERVRNASLFIPDQFRQHHPRAGVWLGVGGDPLDRREDRLLA